MNNCWPQRTNVLDFLCLASGIKITSSSTTLRQDVTGWIQGFQFANIYKTSYKVITDTF
jgi:hypothetical protein